LKDGVYEQKINEKIKPEIQVHDKTCLGFTMPYQCC